MDHDLVDIQLEIIASNNYYNIILYHLSLSSLDFSSLFDWNTKQLFVYVVASYKTDKYVS